MFTKGYSRRVGLHNWEAPGFATGEAIRRGKEELQVNAGRCEGDAPGGSRGPSREQRAPGKKANFVGLWRMRGRKGGGGECTRGQQVSPVGSPAAAARPRGFPALPGQEAVQQQQSVAVTRSLEKGKLSCEKINIISSRI